MDKDIKDLGIKWTLPESEPESPKPSIYFSAPFSGISSPILNNKKPLIVHDLLQEQQKDAYQQSLNKQLDVWGEYSKNYIDFDALTKANTLLVQGVIDGDLEKVNQALINNADPNLTVNLYDSQSDSYKTVPIGVACIFQGENVAKESNTPADSYFSIAKKLLLTGHDINAKSKIDLGPNPDKPGYCFAYKSASVENGKVETRLVDVSLSQSVLICKVIPQSLNDVPRPTDGIAIGEELSNSTSRSYMNLYDPGKDTLASRLKDYRSRQSSLPKPKDNNSKDNRFT